MNPPHGRTIAALQDDNRTLADYGVDQNGYIINVGTEVSTNDKNLLRSLHAFVEDPNLNKFELIEDEYAQRNGEQAHRRRLLRSIAPTLLAEPQRYRKNTVMAYKARHKKGRFADTTEKNNSSRDTLHSNMVVGARVQIGSSSRVYQRLGTIRFIGETTFAKGIWVGVEYDEPVGKNDGTIGGERYFEAKNKYGGFVKPDTCMVGNWAPLSIEDELEVEGETNM